MDSPFFAGTLKLPHANKIEKTNKKNDAVLSSTPAFSRVHL
jgi:hypothetical protein